MPYGEQFDVLIIHSREISLQIIYKAINLCPLVINTYIEAYGACFHQIYLYAMLHEKIKNPSKVITQHK
jgi:hypothetical protein